MNVYVLMEKSISGWIWYFLTFHKLRVLNSKICHVGFANLISLSILKCVFPHEKGQYIRAIFIYSYLMNRKNTDPVLFSIKHISPLNNKIRDLGTSETIPFGASFSKEVIYTQHNALRGWSLDLEYSLLMKSSCQTNNLIFSIKITFVWNNFLDSTLKNNWTSNRK